MAMRPRGGGGGGSRRRTRAGVVRSVYEDFKPVSEWQQDQESHVLSIHLPGFMKEQIRVTTEGRNTIRVRGERLVAGNKWSRFREDFHVPGDGEMNSVRVDFQGGILTIAVPKEGVGKPEDAPAPETRGVDDIQNPSFSEEKGGVRPQSFLDDPRMERHQDGSRKQTIRKPEARSLDDNLKQATPEKGQVKAIPEVKGGVEAQSFPDDPKQPIPPRMGRHEEKSSERVKVSAELDNRHGLDETSQDTEKEESSENQSGRSFISTRTTGNELSKNAEKPEDVTKEKVQKEGEESVEGSELPEAETTNTKDLEKSRATGNSEKIADSRVSKQQNYTKAVKGLTELNEERQLLVNMGVAMLVIVALTAYITHSFASAEHKN